MASFRDIKRRIGGVQNIQQITRAMKMVAGARLRRAEEAILALRPYSARLDKLCARFLQAAIEHEHPFLRPESGDGRAVLVICSDRGLCGAYNNRIVQDAVDLLAERAGQKQFVVPVGVRGFSRLERAGYEMPERYEDVLNPVHFDTAQEITRVLERLFLREDVSEVVMVFTEFFSPMSQVVTRRRLLPCRPELIREDVAMQYSHPVPEGLSVEPEDLDEGTGEVYVYEPGFEQIGQELLQHNLSVQVYRALLEAQASEQGARMVAMDNATTNAEDMIDELTLKMNRVRQESITSEILDVVGGASAIK